MSEEMKQPYNRLRFCYPQPFRRDHYPELATTADELADGSWSARQAASLATNGLRTRARLAAHGDPVQLLAPTIRLALFAYFLLYGLGPLVAYRSGDWPWEVAVLGPTSLVAAIALAVRANGVATVLVVAAAVHPMWYTHIEIAAAWDDRRWLELFGWFVAIVSYIGWAGSVAGWLWRRTDESDRLLGRWWLLGAGVLAASSLATGISAVLLVPVFALLGLSVVGLAIGAWDPRPLVPALVWLPLFIASQVLWAAEEGDLRQALYAALTLLVFGAGFMVTRRAALQAV